MKISRGDLVVATFPGDYGKPRPALVVQSDAFDGLPSLTVLPLTSSLNPTPVIRIDVAPNETTGLQRRSQIMVDKAATISRTRVGQRIGRVDDPTMDAVRVALERFLDIG